MITYSSAKSKMNGKYTDVLQGFPEPAKSGITCPVIPPFCTISVFAVLHGRKAYAVYGLLISGVDKSGGSGIIDVERAMAAKSFDKAAEFARKELKVSIHSLSELPLETINVVNNSIGKLYKDVPSLAGVIDEVLV
ncbi:hypothetical protein, partial [Ruminococcus sp.]|uniref:hypothetical protein n=1 Tax=Ruminococcus sp. TaxID=41978 RepID=UPI003F0A9877